MNIFELAMEKEKISEDYYRQLADRTSNAGLRNICNMLAGEEARHYRAAAKMKENTDPQLAETTILIDAKAVFSKMRVPVEKFNFDITERQLYETARNNESESIKFYLDLAEQADNARHKDIFLKLAAQEKKHFVLWENIMDFVAAPETWLENAEWYHLEQY